MSKKSPSKATPKTQTKPVAGSALVPAASHLPSTDQIDGLGKYAKTGAPQWIGDLLKFNGKTGEYTAGSQELPINKGHILVAAVTEMLAGGVLWKNGELADQIWMPASQFDWRAVRSTLPDQDRALWPKDEGGNSVDPWKEAVMLPMIDPNTFAEYTFQLCRRCTRGQKVGQHLLQTARRSAGDNAGMLASGGTASVLLSARRQEARQNLEPRVRGFRLHSGF